MANNFQPIDTAELLPLVSNGMNIGVINESRLSLRPFSGGEIGGTYEGPDAAIRPLILQLFNYGYSIDYKKSKGPISTLSFSSAWNAGSTGGGATNPNGDYLDTWELVRNTVQKELLESDHPLVSPLSSDDLILLKNVFSGQVKLVGNAYPSFTGGGIPGTVPSGATWTDEDSIAAGRYLYSLNQSGVKTIPVKQPILKLTRTTNPLYDAPFYVGNVDRILSTATMLFDSNVPSNFAIPLITLSEQLMARSGGIIQQSRTDGLTLKFGWYKDLDSSNKHGNKRIQYILQYQFGLWDVQQYGEPL